MRVSIATRSSRITGAYARRDRGFTLIENDLVAAAVRAECGAGIRLVLGEQPRHEQPQRRRGRVAVGTVASACTRWAPSVLEEDH